MHRYTLFWATLTLTLISASTTAFAADRAIAVPPAVQMSWEFVTPGTGARLRPHLGVGFWQRASGAKPGVGANYVSALEYQLPEAVSARVRSASFQFSGRQSQCVGAEPVVIDVYAYAADGRADVGDAHAGSRVAQFSANCSDNPAFARPIDVTAIVRQLSVPSGIRYVGFNIRKANNRQGPGLFDLTAGKLTVVLADQGVAQPPMARSPGQRPGPLDAAAPSTRAPMAQAPMPTPMQAGANMPVRAGVPQGNPRYSLPPRTAAASAAAQRNAAFKQASQ